MKNYKLSTALAVSLAVASTSLVADATDISGILPNAQPGECYAKVIIPAKFETTTEKVLVKEASERLQIIPAKFGTATERVLVKEASTRLTVIPATYKKTTEKVLVRDEEVLWQTSLKNNIPVSAEILAAAKTGGADIDGMAPGTCYREYFTPATYSTSTQTYVSKEASASLQVIPATYEYAEERILVKEASQRIVKVPATYETVTEKILVEPEKTMWKKSQCNGRNNDCGVMCLVTTPARYKTVTKRVIKTPATTKVVDIPAVYKTIKVKKLATPATVKEIPLPEKTSTYSVTSKTGDATFSWVKVGEKATGKYTGHQVCKLVKPAQYRTITKTVVATPATTKEVEIPAVYKDVTVTKLVAPAEVKRITIPEEYSTITKRNMVSPSSVQWKRVVCQSSMGTSTIRAVQTALKNEGLYTGPIDGINGVLTRNAIKAYQKAHGLSVGGLTHEVMKALGVSF
jgi:regulator of extracellular matrix RemA (YlzA/DUF370 family)